MRLFLNSLPQRSILSPSEPSIYSFVRSAHHTTLSGNYIVTGKHQFVDFIHTVVVSPYVPHSPCHLSFTQ